MWGILMIKDQNITSMSQDGGMIHIPASGSGKPRPALAPVKLTWMQWATLLAAKDMDMVRHRPTDP